VRALCEAGNADGSDWAAIAGMLGFEQQAPAAPADTSVSLPRPPRPATVPAEETAERKPPAAPAAPGGKDNDEIGEPVEFDLERSAAPAEAVALDPAPHPQAPGLSPLPFRSLFDALGERGILIEAAGTPCPEGALILQRAVVLIARGEALHDLPVEKIQSTSKGCQILLDTGIGMQPFAKDGRELVRALRRTVGAEHTNVLTFVDCPSGGVMTGRYEDESYAPPGNGAMVLAISDLCRGGPRSALREAEPEEWLAVATQIRDAGNTLVVLNPYPPARWPAAVARRIPVVHWTAATRAADVRRVRRRFRG